MQSLSKVAIGESISIPKNSFLLVGSNFPDMGFSSLKLFHITQDSKVTRLSDHVYLEIKGIEVELRWVLGQGLLSGLEIMRFEMIELDDGIVYFKRRWHPVTLMERTGIGYLYDCQTEFWLFLPNEGLTAMTEALKFINYPHNPARASSLWLGDMFK